MTQLPASIEQYLQEAGFSSTEILVLKRLLEGEALTLRELAAKTGKSTGVLDQAIKKLSEKNIVLKESINDVQKYTIGSLEAIQRWVESDMMAQHAALKRKKENFDAFLSTVEHQKGRPEMEFFEGKEGIQRAFEKLLALGVPKWLHFAPALAKEEEGPLAEYRVQLFRKRRQGKIFLRALAPDEPLGRRFQSRDAFEYRDTRLVPPSEFPVSFEQYIVGDTVACIDVETLKASFIHFPQLADGQRKLFEVMWQQVSRRESQNVKEAPKKTEEVVVPWKTKLVSALRGCFLSKSAILVLVACAIVAFVITSGLYLYTLKLMKEEIGTRLQSIAAIAATQFTTNNLSALNVARDMNTKEYQSVFAKLNHIRESNDDIAYAYILKPSTEQGMFVFVADADSNYNLPAYSDDNENGIADNDEWNVAPGVYYYAGDQLISTIGLKEPVAEKDFIVDQWGVYLTSSAPIQKEGVLYGILALDVDVTEVYHAVRNQFFFPMWFFLIFATLLGIRFLILLRETSK
ncbi:MAG: hypothetical protein KC680_01815 [Candidatus Peregrinibacteria bacterium]|nr:hypothetical protein [Candidatus Peregrinibacteria bacterium]MCB9807676.1 hypothetical protein [Candidatus Peribacteria bacterium]